jgi:hypothetical protein
MKPKQINQGSLSSRMAAKEQADPVQRHLENTPHSDEPAGSLLPQLQLVCQGCQQKIGFDLKDCPWCGASLADAVVLSEKFNDA